MASCLVLNYSMSQNLSQGLRTYTGRRRHIHRFNFLSPPFVGRYLASRSTILNHSVSQKFGYFSLNSSSDLA